MQTTSTLWNTYFSALSKTYEYKAVIGGEEYLSADIYGIEISGGVCTDNAFSIGNCISRKLNISVKPKATPIPKMAAAVTSIRMTGTSGATDWLPLGTFYIDTRRKGTNRVDLECYDKMLMLETPFITSEVIDDFPMPMADALTTILTQLSTTMKNPTAINAGFGIEYPNDMTMREVLSYIGSANGGNFVINAAGQLQLVIPTNSAPVGSAPHKGFDEINDARTFSRITMVWGDNAGEYFTAGDDTGDELIVTNPWATQAICDHVLTLLDGYVHTPYVCTGAYINPAAELGDVITFGDFDGAILTAITRYAKGGVVWDVGAGGDGSVEHEYPYQGTFERRMKSKVTQNAAYYGVTISRQNGLKITKTDGSAEAIFNSDVLAMRAKVDGVMKDKLYFDPINSTYVFDGKLSAGLIEALEAEFDVTISNTVIVQNLYSEYGRIANLTVSELDTGWKKITNYLVSDTSDVNFSRRYEQYDLWITASTDGAETEQATDKNGRPLYWTDETHTGMTLTENLFPVLTYVYTELVKCDISFESDGINYNPAIKLGAGSGVGDRDKLIIRKVDDKAVILYTTDSGTEITLSLSADGIICEGNTGAKGIRNIAVSATEPTSPQTNDLWIDTEA